MLSSRGGWRAVALAALGVGVVLAVGSPSARAASPAADKAKTAEAKDWAEKGKVHFKLGEFTEAVRCYKEAYRARAEAVHLYNIALSYRELGDFKESVRYYELYLHDDPESPVRKDIEARVAEMKKHLAEGEAVKKAPPSDPLHAGSAAPGSGAVASPDLAKPPESAGAAGTAGGVSSGGGSASAPAAAPGPGGVKRRSTGLALGVALGGIALIVVAGAVVGTLLALRCGASSDALRCVRDDYFPSDTIEFER